MGAGVACCLASPGALPLPGNANAIAMAIAIAIKAVAYNIIA